MSYIVYAWVTSLAYGTGGIIGKLTSKYQIANPWLFNFVWIFMTLIFILPIALYNGFGWPTDWGSILILSFFNAVSGIFYILCLYRVDISVLAPFYSLRTPLVVLLGVLLFGEALSGYQLGLIALIVIGGLFVTIDEQMSIKSLLNRNLALMLFTMMVSAFYNVSIKNASLRNGFWEVVFWSNLLGVMFTLPTAVLFFKDIKKMKIRKLTGITLSTVFATLGLLASFRALGDNVSISIAIMSLPLSMLIAISLSVISPKFLEKHTAKVYAIRLVSAAVMVSAAVGLSV